MTAMFLDDMVLELSRIARVATERMLQRRKAEQLGLAFEGLPRMKTFPLPTVPAKAD